MRTTAPIVIAGVLSLAGCATGAVDGRGWRGQGAEPFDAAREACTAEAGAQPEGAARIAAFEACMAGKGWHRP